jgi:hypothetical protein
MVFFHQRIQMSMSIKQRIILVDSSRLLREMLHVVIYKTDHLQLVREFSSYEELPSAIEQLEAEWLIVSLPVDKGIPDWVDDYITSHPLTRFMAVSADSSKVKMKWVETHEEDLEDLSLKDLIHVLESDPNKLASPRPSNC